MTVHRRVDGAEVVLLDRDDGTLHLPGTSLGVTLCGIGLVFGTLGPAPAIEPLARVLCAACWPIEDGVDP